MNLVIHCDSEKEIRVEVARQREMKWLDMFNNWDKWIKHRFQKVRTILISCLNLWEVGVLFLCHRIKEKCQI